MRGIHTKTLSDLEFFEVLDAVSEYCLSNLGKDAVQKLRPYQSFEDTLLALHKVNEYVSSFESNNHVPSHFFYELTQELKLLAIEESVLEPDSFIKIVKNYEATAQLVLFFKKHKVQFPTLFELSEEIVLEKIISKEILATISMYGEIKDNASPYLRKIRKEINALRSLIEVSFSKALRTYQQSGFLDEIKESVVDNQRVLAVQAMCRKKVKGNLVGSSKSGNIVFMIPNETTNQTRELQNLLYDEKQEIRRILKELTQFIRDYGAVLSSYCNYLIEIDVVSSKAKYAQKIDACLPNVSDKPDLELVDAYHPILLAKYKKQHKVAIPQTLALSEEQQIIVVSGPNAGGKSITLKTIGILQLMWQSGMLVCVSPKSTMGFFKILLTDIGDNQSIENQLSTYSYRLKNMRNFLRKGDANTLFLIDEFGTGSDPELGGALAEILLEELYAKKAKGMVTTHYSNLKILADNTTGMINANMQFDSSNFQPLFKLLIGQAGSSYTFEVAQKNGIPFNIINRAKKRVEGGKVQLEKTISKLQQERHKLQQSHQHLEKEKLQTIDRSDSLEASKQKLDDKLEDFQKLYDENQRMLVLGRTINEYLNTYLQTNNKKQLTAQFSTWVQKEKTKFLKRKTEKVKPTIKKKKNLETKELKNKIKKTEEEVLQKIVKVRVEKEKIKEAKEKQRINHEFKMNDRVRLLDTNMVGVITKIEKNKVFINYGHITTHTNTNNLELVI